MAGEVPVKAREPDGAVTGPLLPDAAYDVVAPGVVVGLALVEALLVEVVVGMLVELVGADVEGGVGVVVDVLVVDVLVVDVLVVVELVVLVELVELVGLVLEELEVVDEVVGGVGNDDPINFSNVPAMTLAPESTGSSPNPSSWPAVHVMSSHVQALSTATGTVPQGDDTISVVSDVWKVSKTSATGTLNWL
jgi:hypothetical protein